MPLPGFVADELRGLLDCGVLAKGCAHLRCKGCGLDRVAALSCKGHGFCPRCAGRRMIETARHLAERVLFTAPIPVQSARDPPDHWTEAYDCH